MSSVPVRNESVHAYPAEDGKSLAVEVKLRYPVWRMPLGRLLKLRERKAFLLDAIGRQVYESIDGKKTFEVLVDEFAERHKLTFFESRGLLMQYVRVLMKNGLVGISVSGRDSKRQTME